MLGCTVDNRLDALYIGLPSPVRAAVGVGDLDSKCNALVTKLAFGHSLEPPRLTNITLFTVNKDLRSHPAGGIIQILPLC